MNDKQLTKAEYAIDAKLHNKGTHKEVKVCDITDTKGVVDILRCQYNSDDDIISIMNKEINYRKRFFGDDVVVENMLKQHV